MRCYASSQRGIPSCASTSTPQTSTSIFWNDPGGEKYGAAYFGRFNNVWCHGDFAEWTEHDGIVIHGRSNATLNPGGVRIGTAEIYNQVERMDEVVEAFALARSGTATFASSCSSDWRKAFTSMQILNRRSGHASGQGLRHGMSRRRY
ncbi:hypothetical protein ATB98_15155 [Sinorhizobium saheli]|uniref:Uncharacterized protein n=1 Tax=Sinorhizobium saheli TaxID=36856 RepID=A0A178YSL3_SINSA|nr:hypothetical protein ATB98_15155 [Sinorhizobium saheli]